MTLPYLKLVERFVAVADAGSIQQAARRLNLSQPSLTQSIKGIETQFECQLFERTKRGVILTKTGERLYQHSREILNSGNLAQQEISDLVSGRSGKLRISAGTAWGYCFLPPLLLRLHALFPELEIELEVGLTEEALPRLYAGELDIVVGAKPKSEEAREGIICEDLFEINFAAACGPNADVPTGDLLTYSDVSHCPVVIYQDDRRLVSEVLREIERSAGSPLSICVRTTSLLSAVELVRNGPFLLFMVEPILKKFGELGIRMLQFKVPLQGFKTAVHYRESLKNTDPFTRLLRMLKDVTADAI